MLRAVYAVLYLRFLQPYLRIFSKDNLNSLTDLKGLILQLGKVWLHLIISYLSINGLTSFV